MGNTHADYTNTQLSNPGQGEQLSVFGDQYCSSQVQSLKATEQFLSFSGDDFEVKDTNGNLVFQMQGRVFSFRQKKLLVDANGHVIGSLKHKLFSFHHQITIVDQNNNAVGFARKSNIFQLSASVKIWLLETPIPFGRFSGDKIYNSQIPTITMKGNWRTKNLIITHCSGNVIAKVQRRAMNVRNFFGRQTYDCEVAPYVDSAFIIMLAVVLDEIYQERGEN